MGSILDVEITVPPLFERLEEAVQLMLPDLVEAMRTVVIARANQELRSTSQDYVQGLSAGSFRIDSRTESVASLKLSGWLPNAIEEGWTGGDMKQWLLNGPNSRPTKDGGRVAVVPFRHGTPGVTGRNFPAMGSQHETHTVGHDGNRQERGAMSPRNAGQLGQDVYSRARNLKPTTSHPDTGVKWGERLPAGLAPKLREHHVTDIFAGMVRQEKVYEGAKQSQYTTFRMVSTKSDPQSWIHPGIRRHAIFEKAIPEFRDAAEKLLQLAVNQLAEER